MFTIFLVIHCCKPFVVVVTVDYVVSKSSLLSRRLEVVQSGSSGWKREQARARETREVFSCAHYLQAPSLRLE